MCVDGASGGSSCRVWGGMILPRLVGIKYVLDRTGHQFYPIFSAPVIITRQENENGSHDIYIGFYRKIRPWFVIILSPYPPFIILDQFEKSHMMLMLREMYIDEKDIQEKDTLFGHEEELDR